MRYMEVVCEGSDEFQVVKFEAFGRCVPEKDSEEVVFVTKRHPPGKISSVLMVVQAFHKVVEVGG